MRGVLQLFHKRSKDLFWNCSRTKLICSRTKLICSRTVLGKTYRIFWNFSRTNFFTSARTIVEQKIVPFNVLHLSHKHSRTYLEHF